MEAVHHQGVWKETWPSFIRRRKKNAFAGFGSVPALWSTTQSGKVHGGGSIGTRTPLTASPLGPLTFVFIRTDTQSCSTS